MENATQVDDPKDFGTGDAAFVARWISELDLSEKDQKKYIGRARETVKRYVDQRNEATDSRKRTYCLLWSNIQTLAPAVYARTPVCVVGRRWKDDDPVARIASEVLERAINFNLDAMDFADAMLGLRDDYLLVGRGQAWVRFVPHFAKPAKAPDGEVTDDTDEKAPIWSEVIADRVHWADWGTNPAMTWADVRFVWRRVYMTRDELIARFGKEKGKACPLDFKPKDGDGQGQRDEQFAKAAVYEIWDKTSREAIWLCKAYTTEPLDRREDPLGLREFFPCPRPLLATCPPDSIIPTPDYAFYQTQDRQIAELTRRIGKLADALQAKGFYAATENQKLTDLFGNDQVLIPIDSWQALSEKGGLDKIISWFPVEKIAEVLKGAIETRQQMLEDVWQITGIADIMRGDNDPRETATAARIKGNWGNSRVRDKQKELARFARDLLRIMGEVIAQKFDAQILSEMTGVKLFPTVKEKQAAQQQAAMMAQMAQASGQPPPPQDPKQARMMGDPTWEEVMAVLEDNATRAFRIDVETDSTIEPNDQEEKERRVEFIEAVGQYLEKTLGVITVAPQFIPVQVEGLKFLVRGFRVGREMEDVIEQTSDKLIASPPQPPQKAGAPQKPGEPPQVQNAKAEAAVTTAQARVMDAQTNRIKAVGGLQQEGQRLQAEDMRSRAELAEDQRQHTVDTGADMQSLIVQAAQQAETRKLRADIMSEKPMKVGTP